MRGFPDGALKGCTSEDRAKAGQVFEFQYDDVDVSEPVAGEGLTPLMSRKTFEVVTLIGANVEGGARP